MIWQLRRHLHVYECNLFGHISAEEELVLNVIFAPTSQKPTLTQIEACIREAERFSLLINQRSPTFTSDFLLSPLTAAQLVESSTKQSAPSKSASMFVVDSRTFVLAAFILLLLW